MQPSFVAYIDEAGDEGFCFREDGSGSSRWFILSAVIIRKRYDVNTVVPAVRELKALFNKDSKKPLHFRNLKHEQRIPLARKIGGMPLRTVSILVHKPCIQDTSRFTQDPYSLYRYCSRLLLERISWLCRDQKEEGDGNGKVELIYSNRTKMSYQELKDYLNLLQYGMPLSDVRIDWKVVDTDLVKAVNHDKLAGLQLADAVASGFYYAFNTNRYGEVETRYAKLMTSTLYRHRSSAIGYGAKLWCTCEEAKIHAIKVVNGPQ